MVLLRGFSLRLSKFTGHSSFLKRPEKVNEKNFKKIATKQTFKEGLNRKMENILQEWVCPAWNFRYSK